MRKSGGNQTKTAKFLKTSRDTLSYRMKKFGLSDSAKEEESVVCSGIAADADSRSPRPECFNWA